MNSLGNAGQAAESAAELPQTLMWSNIQTKQHQNKLLRTNKHCHKSIYTYILNSSQT